MKRGEVFTFSMKGAAGKPRPGIVVQADEFIRADRPVLACPLTSETSDAAFFRIAVEPSPENGLRTLSQAMLDRLGAALPREFGVVIGRLSPDDMIRVELALVNILGLSRASSLSSAAREHP